MAAEKPLPPTHPEATVEPALRAFAGFTLVRQIGRGGMGVVYEAVDTAINRTVALKLIIDSKDCSPVARRRFVVEAEAAARLDHPNIVPIYHVGENEDRPYITMKFVRGENLRIRMDRGELGLTPGGKGMTKSNQTAAQRAIARLIAAVARAVHHAHSQNVLHRDLKPANILLDPQGDPQLTDFGLAKIVDGEHLQVTTSGTVLGTVPYMAPEQVRGERLSAETDTYSLGVVLYELLAGQRPFRQTTLHETMRAIDEQPPVRLRQLNRSIPADLETICLKCLEKHPVNRYSSTLGLAEDLERWLRDEPISARPVGPVVRVCRWTRRNPMGMSLILSLGLAFVALVALFIEVGAQRELEDKILLGKLEETVLLLWSDPNQTNLTLSAETLASMCRWRFPDIPEPSRLTLAMEIGENATADARAIAPLLRELQHRMSRTLRTNVVLDLKICKSYARFNELASGQADFQRLAGVPFWQAKDHSPGVRAIVQDRLARDTVIVVRRDSAITNLSGLIGRSFAFPDTNSTLGVLAKSLLVANGVNQENLKYYDTIDDREPLEDPAAIKSPEDVGRNHTPFRTPGSASGVAAAERVLAGHFDGAVLQARYFERIKHKESGLRAIHTFLSTPNVFAARAGLEPEVVEAFRKAMLALNDSPELLQEAPMYWSKEGFEAVDLSTLSQLHHAMTNEALLFTIPRPPPSEYRPD